MHHFQVTLQVFPERGTVIGRVGANAQFVAVGIEDYIIASVLESELTASVEKQAMIVEVFVGQRSVAQRTSELYVDGVSRAVLGCGAPQQHLHTVGQAELGDAVVAHGGLGDGGWREVEVEGVNLEAR